MAGGSPPFSREGRQSSLELPEQPGAHRGGGTALRRCPFPCRHRAAPSLPPALPPPAVGAQRPREAALSGASAERGGSSVNTAGSAHSAPGGGIPKGSLPSHPLQLLACRSDPGTARRAAPCLFAKGSTALSRWGWQRRAGRTALHSPARDGRARGRHSAPGPAT